MLMDILNALHLNPDTFPNLYLAIFVPIHAAAAIYGATIAFPLAVFARKGSRYHRLFGRMAVGTAAVVVISSFFLAANSKINSIVVEATVFPAGKYNQFYLILLSIVFSYYCFSAARIWPRLRGGKGQGPAANWFDWTLTLLALATAALYLVTGILTLGTNNVLSVIYILATTLLVPYALFDVYTFLYPPRSPTFPWWIVHMSKMLLVWITLVRFIIFRVFAMPADLFVRNQVVAMIFFLSLAGLLVAWNWRHFQTPARSL